MVDDANGRAPTPRVQSKLSPGLTAGMVDSEIKLHRRIMPVPLNSVYSDTFLIFDLHIFKLPTDAGNEEENASLLPL